MAGGLNVVVFSFSGRAGRFLRAAGPFLQQVSDCYSPQTGVSGSEGELVT